MNLRDDEIFAVLIKPEYEENFNNINNKSEIEIEIINIIKNNPEEIRKIINEDEKEEKDNGEKE